MTDIPAIPIYGFMHIATHGHWRTVFQEQLEKMTTSGLYAASDRIFLTLLGPLAAEFTPELPKLEVLHRSPDFDEFEFPTLTAIRNFALKQSTEAHIFYLHSKGVFNDTPFTRDWRHYMEYFLIEKYPACIQALHTHDLCGVNWSEDPWPHYSGNFWWARASYLRTLPAPTDLDTISTKGHTRRHNCERWLATANPNVTSLHQSHINHYREPYPRQKYASPE